MITFVSKHQPTFGDLASCFFTCMSLPSNFHLCTRYKNRNFLLNYIMQPQNNCVVIRILVCSLLLSNFSISCTMRPKPFSSGICISWIKNFVISFKDFHKQNWAQYNPHKVKIWHNTIWELTTVYFVWPLICFLLFTSLSIWYLSIYRDFFAINSLAKFLVWRLMKDILF